MLIPANPAAVNQYEGLKHTNDFDDAYHLANLLRLGILPEGYIEKKKELITVKTIGATESSCRRRCGGGGCSAMKVSLR